MVFYIILFLCLVFGILVGLYAGMSMLKPKPGTETFQKDPERAHASEISWDETETELFSKADINHDETDEVAIAKNKEQQVRSLKERMESRSSIPSMVEFNSIANHEDYESKLHQNRDKQDDAYNVIKSTKRQAKPVVRSQEQMMEDEQFMRASRESAQFVQDTGMMAAAQMQQQMQQLP